MPKNRLLLALGAGALALMLVACGGDKKADDPSASGGSASSRSVDLSKASESVRELKSFRFDMTMKLDLGAGAVDLDDLDLGAEDDFGGAMLAAIFGGLGDIKVEGAFVAPDKADLKMSIAGFDLGYVQIGDKAWQKALGKWEVTKPDADSLGFGGSPADLFESFLPQEVLNNAKTSRESVNGTSATRYSFDKAALQSLAADMGEDFSDLTDAKLDLWMNDDDIPVKVVMNMAGKDDSGSKMSIALELNLRDINKSITIKAPI